MIEFSKIQTQNPVLFNLRSWSQISEAFSHNDVTRYRRSGGWDRFWSHSYTHMLCNACKKKQHPVICNICIVSSLQYFTVQKWMAMMYLNSCKIQLQHVATEKFACSVSTRHVTACSLGGLQWVNGKSHTGVNVASLAVNYNQVKYTKIKKKRPYTVNVIQFIVVWQTFPTICSILCLWTRMNRPNKNFPNMNTNNGQDHSIKTYVPFKNLVLKDMQYWEDIHVSRLYYTYRYTHTHITGMSKCILQSNSTATPPLTDTIVVFQNKMVRRVKSNTTVHSPLTLLLHTWCQWVMHIKTRNIRSKLVDCIKMKPQIFFKLAYDEYFYCIVLLLRIRNSVSFHWNKKKCFIFIRIHICIFSRTSNICNSFRNKQKINCTCCIHTLTEQLLLTALYVYMCETTRKPLNYKKKIWQINSILAC
jgi:hypothetical protein